MIHFDISNHRPLREIVYEELKEMILKGEIKPGTRMMEIELAEEMGVSRTPIREAIRKLEKEGLISIEPRKGAYVTEISVKGMVNILEVRSVLEGLSAELATERMSMEEKKELLEYKDNFDLAVKEGNMKMMIYNDTMFHHLIYEGTKNEQLIDMMELLQKKVLQFRYIYYKDFKRAEEMPAEHDQIYKALINGEGLDARRASFRHIALLKELVERENFI